MNIAPLVDDAQGAIHLLPESRDSIWREFEARTRQDPAVIEEFAGLPGMEPLSLQSAAPEQLEGRGASGAPLLVKWPEEPAAGGGIGIAPSTGAWFLRLSRPEEAVLYPYDSSDELLVAVFAPVIVDDNVYALRSVGISIGFVHDIPQGVEVHRFKTDDGRCTIVLSEQEDVDEYDCENSLCTGDCFGSFYMDDDEGGVQVFSCRCS